MRLHRVALTLSGLLLVTSGCGGGSSSGGPPLPAGVGTQRGQPQLLLIDPVSGGNLIVTDLAGTATITVTVPPGALAAATNVIVTEITNTAPGGVGSAWRIGPEGIQLAVPVTLTFKPGVQVDTLGVSTQATGGFWIRRRDVIRDVAGGTLSVSTDHFSDWAVTAAGSARDLQGVVTIVQTGTIDIPATVTGPLTLDYSGDVDGTSFYILGGTLNAPATVPDGAATCTPDQPAFAVRSNVAELRISPARFRWGTSGVWPLGCTGPGGDYSSTLYTAFDNMGIGYPGCARTDLTAPVAMASQIQGQYLIDCGSRGTVTATWNFVTCQAGAVCDPSAPCRTGAISCATALPSCEETGNEPDGTACGSQPADACQAGACVLCNPTDACTPTDPCRTGTVLCETSPSSCVPTGDRPDGTLCGTQAADHCVAGACSICSAGSACGTPGICQVSALVCTTSPATCSITSKPDGTSCGPQAADVCAAGACSLCPAGSACGAPTECQTSALVCTTSPASCSITSKPDGTACGTQPGDRCVAGACAVCQPGAACGTPNECQTSALVCTASPASCSISSKPDGTACGTQPGDHCIAGACSVCQPGAACGAPNECQVSALVCTTTPATCDIQSRPDGTACGTQPADHCVGGACAVCSPLASCVPADPCRTGTVSCDTSPASCLATGNVPDGTSCGPQAADQCFAGVCNLCPAGSACGAPTICQTSALVCSTNPATCSIQNRPDGTSCGPQAADVCAAGACNLCPAGSACGAPSECQTSALVCTSNPATCSIVNKPDGTACGTQPADQCLAGVCNLCPAGSTCGAPTACQTSALVCSTNPATCSVLDLPDGTSCGPQAADVCAAGACNLCPAGSACGTPTACQTSALVCSTNPATCSILDLPDGTSCGPQPADVCAAGACATCQPGAACGAPNECQTTALVCTTTPATCDVQSMPDGTACGTQPGDQCAGGACAICVPGAACGAPTECQTSATDCTTSPAGCDIQNMPEGTGCSVGTCSSGVCG